MSKPIEWNRFNDTQKLVLLTIAALMLGMVIAVPVMNMIKQGRKQAKSVQADASTFTQLIEGRPSVGQGQQIVLVEDFMCGGCKAFTTKEWPPLYEAAKRGEAELVFVAVSSHSEGLERAAAAQCVYDMNPDGFWAFKKSLFQKQNARELDLLELAPVNDKQALKNCMSGKGTIVTQENLELALSLGVQATPSFVIGGLIYQNQTAQDLLAAANPFAQN